MTRRVDPPWVCRWYAPHVGKFWKRCLHKAHRAYARGYGRERRVVRLSREVNYKLW